MESDVQKIVNRILQDAREEAQSIFAEAQRAAQMLLEDRRESARQRAGEDAQFILKRAENEAQVARGKAIMDAKREEGWKVLSEKERLVSSVLNEVKSKLAALPESEEYVRFLEKVIVDAGTALGGGKLEVVLNKDNSSPPLRISMLAESIAENTGVKTQLKISKEKIDAHGAIVKTFDGRIVADNTFEAMLKRREKELRFKIAKILFGRPSTTKS